MSFDFKLPDLGEGIHEAEILNVKITEGQIIAEDQLLFEVETDKAVVEIPSPVAGKIIKINVQAGQIVTVGSVMVSVDENSHTDNKATSVILSKDSEDPIKQHKVAASINPVQESTSTVIATPATRQLARELKVDLHMVKGSGPGGRIAKEDILLYVDNQKEKPLSSQSEADLEYGLKRESIALPDFTKYGEIERLPIKSLRRKTAQQMSLSWSKIPHVTHCDEADVTELDKLIKKYAETMKKQGTKLTLTAFIMKAVAIALQKYPQFNASLNEQSEEIIIKRYYNIGMAVATDRGLIVPVIQSVDKKTILELALEITQAAEKARAAKTELHELHGGTFTITNIGSIGGIIATPIINYPESAILAVMKSKEKPVIKKGKIEAALIVPLCLAFDHRLADGAQAAHLMRIIIKMLEEPDSFEKYIGT